MDCWLAVRVSMLRRGWLFRGREFRFLRVNSVSIPPGQFIFDTDRTDNRTDSTIRAWRTLSATRWFSCVFFKKNRTTESREALRPLESLRDGSVRLSVESVARLN